MYITRQKGQGLTEYGVILLLICTVGVMIYTGFNIKGSIKALYSTVNNNLVSVTDSLGYDTGNTITLMTKDKNGKYTIPVQLHETKLSFEGKTINWYTSGDNTIKRYVYSSDKDGILNQNNWLNYNESATYYFKGDDGKYYTINTDGSSLHQYTGDVSFMNGSDYNVKYNK